MSRRQLEQSPRQLQTCLLLQRLLVRDRAPRSSYAGALLENPFGIAVNERFRLAA
jgi:hypothetical protein